MNSKKEVVKNVIEYLEKNLENDIDLDKISDKAGYSKYHLNRLFAEETGCTIYKYLQTRRLTIAAEKLVESNIPISQIGFEAGYNSQQAFTLAFKEIYLYSPKVYREQGMFFPRQNKIVMEAQYRSGYNKKIFYGMEVKAA